MVVLLVLILTGVFHGYVSGYPAAGMLKIINIFFPVFLVCFFFSLSYAYCEDLTTETLATLAICLRLNALTD